MPVVIVLHCVFTNVFRFCKVAIQLICHLTSDCAPQTWTKLATLLRNVAFLLDEQRNSVYSIWKADQIVAALLLH